MDAIRTENLTKSFGKLIAVNELNLSIQEGEIFGLIGPDGSGKTTTMRMLASILDPTSGSGSVLGYSLKNQAENIKACIGYMSQRFGLYPDLTVQENIDFYADIYNVIGKERQNRQEELLRFSGLMPFKDRFAKALSGGMKQKLGLICALIHSPKLVLLDEPTNGVDPVSRRDFWDILKSLQMKGMTILMSTSYLDEAEKCDRIALLNEGKILLMGSLDEMRKTQKEILMELIVQEPRKNIHLFQNARLFGNKIHLNLKSRAEISQLEAFCKEKGIVLLDIKQIQPSLEDIFIEEVKT